MSRWTDWVRKWAKDHDTSYGCALTQEDCRAEYHKKYGNRKKLPRKTERELMGMEDKDAGEEIYILPKKKPKKKKPKKMLIIESDSEEEDDGKPVGDLVPFQKIIEKKIETKKSQFGKVLQEALDERKRLIEMSRMMGEDYNVSKKKKPDLIIESDSEEEIYIVPKKKAKKVKKPLIIEEDEDEDVIKNAPKKTLDDFIDWKEGDPPALKDWKSRNHWLWRRLTYNISGVSRAKIMKELGIPVGGTQNIFKAIEEGKTTYKEVEKLIEKYNKRIGENREILETGDFDEIKTFLTKRYYAKHLKELAVLYLNFGKEAVSNPVKSIIEALKAGEFDVKHLIKKCKEMEQTWEDDHEKLKAECKRAGKPLQKWKEEVKSDTPFPKVEKDKKQVELIIEEVEEDNFDDIRDWLNKRYYAVSIKQLATTKRLLGLNPEPNVSNIELIINALKSGTISLDLLKRKSAEMEKNFIEDNKKLKQGTNPYAGIPQGLKASPPKFPRS